MLNWESGQREQRPPGTFASISGVRVPSIEIYDSLGVGAEIDALDSYPIVG